MPGEIITLNVGECGINLGSTIWEQYNLEHGVDPSGNKSLMENNDDFLCFYEQTDDGKFMPRNLMIDLEPESIDNIQASKYGKLFNVDYSSASNDGTAGCFARGYYSVGKKRIESITDTIRLMVENCDEFQGFTMNHSVGGGTGSGLGSLLLERLSIDYSKKAKDDFAVYPFNDNHSNNTVEPYNAFFYTHWSLDYAEVSFIFDSRQSYNICKNKLLIQEPTYYSMNSIISKISSGLTVSLRAEDKLYSHSRTLNDYQTNLVPFPRLHFIISSMAPLIVTDENKKYPSATNMTLIDGFIRENSVKNKLTIYEDVMNEIYLKFGREIIDRNSTKELSEDICDSEYFSVECLDYDCKEDKILDGVIINYRGDIGEKEANKTTQWLYREKRCIPMIGWSPSGWKMGLFDNTAELLQYDDMVIGNSKRQGYMYSNHACISRFFSERITKTYDKMYSQRAFVHWYIREGMELGEFAEAREDLGFLEKDYLDCVREQATDDEEEEWSDDE